ncbi:MAG: DUF2085 domain-containing protein [Chloroflexi bacterium]|nr:DUF2085 domain-containing protein [Chloroflexota bacterium]
MATGKKALRARVEAEYADLTRRKRGAVRLLNNWWKYVTALIGIYVALPILAPVLMASGATGPGEALYTIYSPMCHQFAFRSAFLFGEQTVYPREAAETEFASFEEYAAQSDEFQEIYTRRRNEELDELDINGQYEFNARDLQEWDAVLQFSAREFRGDERMGYKIALCQRDIMIYLTMFVAALIFGVVKDRLRPAPIALYIFLGILPIALDGFSQLFGYPPFNEFPIFENWQVRETSPYFRFLTGALFGMMNVWLAFPYIHRSARDNVARIEASLAEIESRNKSIRANLKEE